jgi:Mg2+ and Co2+ transporter CorA
VPITRSGRRRRNVLDRSSAADESGLRLLQDRFGFHPPTIEDCIKSNQRSKIDEYGDPLFIVTHSMSVTDRADTV